MRAGAAAVPARGFRIMTHEGLSRRLDVRADDDQDRDVVDRGRILCASRAVPRLATFGAFLTGFAAGALYVDFTTAGDMLGVCDVGVDMYGSVGFEGVMPVGVAGGAAGLGAAGAVDGAGQ